MKRRDRDALKLALLDERPILLALAGSNGAGKTTFYHSHLSNTGLRFINADVIARELHVDAYVAARFAGALRDELLRQGESFIFETVFSDPVGDKINFLKRASALGYTVVLLFIGIAGPDISEERIAMRLSQGGHDVPPEKLATRYPRTMNNLKSAIHELPIVIVFDNDDLGKPFRQVAIYQDGKRIAFKPPAPAWLPQDK